MSEFKYLAISSPSLTIKLAGKRWQAVGGVLHLSDVAAAELDQLMKTRPDLASQIRKINMEKAAQIAKEYLASQPPAAVKGPVTSVDSASAKIRKEREAQKSENLIGVENPVNISTIEQKSEPLKVEQIPTEVPKTSALLNKLK